MRASPWFRRLEVALEFDSGFEIFLLLGRGELARPALGRIAEELQRFGAPHWHRLDLGGLDSLLSVDQPAGVLHLVHGLERMSGNAAAELVARLNVNRDRLEVLGGPVIFWIPEDFYEELLRQAPDFVAWRSQATVVPDADIGASPEVWAEEFLLCETHRVSADAMREVPALDVLVRGERRSLLNWVAGGELRSLCWVAEDAPARVLSWCAGQLARRWEAGDYDKVPVVLPALLLALAERGEGREALLAAVARSWAAGALHVIVTTVLTSEERAAQLARLGGNRALVMVRGEPGGVRLAPLSEAQVDAVIERGLADLGPHEREPWREVMAQTVELFAGRIERFAILSGVIREWRERRLSKVTSDLQRRGWREHSFWLARGFFVESSPFLAPGSLTLSFDVFVQPDTLCLARSLYAFGARTSSEALLRCSVELFRGESGSKPRVGLVEASIALAQRSVALEDRELEAQRWTDAVTLAGELEPENPRLLAEALDGLGFVQYLAGEYEQAEQTVREALALVAGQRGGFVAGLYLTLTKPLLEQGRFVEALDIAELGLRALEGEADADQATGEELLELADQACVKMGFHDRALEFAHRKIECRRTRSPKLWMELTIFAQRLLESAQLEQALAIITEAVELLDTEDDGPPYHGQADALILLADIHRARSEREQAVAAMREAIRTYRAVIDDGGPWWTPPELAQALLTLADDLSALDRDDALDSLLEALAILEQLDRLPGHYPDDLAAALAKLGDYAATHGRPELAATAYARILTLAAPFPARESEPVREIGRRLEVVCREAGVTPDEALARGQYPVDPAAAAGRGSR